MIWSFLFYCKKKKEKEKDFYQIASPGCTCWLLRQTRLMVISPIGILWHAPKLNYFVSFVTPLRNGNIFEILNSHVKAAVNVRRGIISIRRHESGFPKKGWLEWGFDWTWKKKKSQPWKPRRPSWRTADQGTWKHEVLRGGLRSSLSVELAYYYLIILLTFRTQCGLSKLHLRTPQTTLKLHIYGPYYSSDSSTDPDYIYIYPMGGNKREDTLSLCGPGLPCRSGALPRPTFAFWSTVYVSMFEQARARFLRDAMCFALLL